MSEEPAENEGNAGEESVIETPTEEVDERGVPKKNVYAEMLRKMDKLERDTARMVEERTRMKDAEIAQLRAELAARQQVQEQPKEEFSKEDLLTAYANASNNPEVQASIVDKLTDIKARESQRNTEAQMQWAQKQEWYNRQAASQYPALMDPQSDFYIQVAGEVGTRLRENERTPRTIYDAANAVASRRPDLAKQNGAVQPRGFAERGSSRPGTVGKQVDELPQLDPKIHASWKQAFPEIKDENIRRRMAEIQKRLIVGSK